MPVVLIALVVITVFTCSAVALNIFDDEDEQNEK